MGGPLVMRSDANCVKSALKGLIFKVIGVKTLDWRMYRIMRPGEYKDQK